MMLHTLSDDDSSQDSVASRLRRRPRAVAYRGNSSESDDEYESDFINDGDENEVIVLSPPRGRAHIEDANLTQVRTRVDCAPSLNATFQYGSEQDNVLEIFFWLCSGFLKLFYLQVVLQAVEDGGPGPSRVESDDDDDVVSYRRKF